MKHLVVLTCSWSSEEPSSNSWLSPHVLSSTKASPSPIIACFWRIQLPMIYYIGFCAIRKVLLVGKEASTILFIGQSPWTGWESNKGQHGHQCLPLWWEHMIAALRWWFHTGPLIFCVIQGCSSSAADKPTPVSLTVCIKLWSVRAEWNQTVVYKSICCTFWKYQNLGLHIFFFSLNIYCDV